MTVRAYDADDLEPLVVLTIETFRPFYEDHVRPSYGERVFRHQHGAWEQDYRELVPTLHRPTEDKFVAVDEVDTAIVGYVAWSMDLRQRHGTIEMLAVDACHRRSDVGRRLCVHALDAMRGAGVEVAGVFTGGDAFHVPARALYESLGATRVDITGYLIDLGAEAGTGPVV